MTEPADAPSHLDYVREVRRFLDEVPLIARRAHAVYVSGSVARFDMQLGSSDLDLVVLADDENDELLGAMRDIVRNRSALGYAYLSAPKLATAEERRGHLSTMAAEYGYRAVVEDQLLLGEAAASDAWRAPPAEPFALQLEDSCWRHFVRSQLCLTQLFRPRPPGAAPRWVRRAITRFLRYALWRELGACVPDSADVLRLAADLYGTWVLDLDGAMRDPRTLWLRLREAMATVAPALGAPVELPERVTRWFEWRVRSFVPTTFGPSSVIWADELEDATIATVRELFAERRIVAVLPTAMAGWFCRRMIPRSIAPLHELARATGVHVDDVTRQALDDLLYYRYNWRNTYLGAPEGPAATATLRTSALKHAHRFASVLDAMVTTKTGEVAATPEVALTLFREHFPGLPAGRFIDDFVRPALAGDGDVGVWNEHMPAFSKLVTVPDALPSRALGVRT